MKKVIFHIDDISSWEKLLNNLKNILREFKMNSDEFLVEVLANSTAVKGYLNSNLIESIKKFEDKISFVACNNSLMANNIEKNNLYKTIKTTNTGVYYLTIKQAEGFSYIKV